MRSHTNHYTFDTYGRNSRTTIAKRGIEKLRDSDGSHNHRRYVATNYTVYPCVVIVPAPQHFEIWTMFPHRTDPSSCITELRFLASVVPDGPAREEQQRYLARNRELLTYAVEQEDWKVSGTIGQGLPGGRVGNLTLGRNEAEMFAIIIGLYFMTCIAIESLGVPNYLGDLAPPWERVDDGRQECP